MNLRRTSRRLNVTRTAVHVVLVIAALSALCVHALASDEFVFVRSGNIWLSRVDGSCQKQLTVMDDAREPSLSPDGRRVAFVSGRDLVTGFGDIYMINVVGGGAAKLKIKGMAGSEQPSFSPDGKRLVFVGMSDVKKRKVKGNDLVTATMSVSVIDLETGAVRRIVSTQNALLDAGYVYRSPSFSFDGKLIAYHQSGSDVSGGFVVVDRRGRTVFRFPKSAEGATPYWTPRFSRDGKSVICYTPATSEGQDEITWLVDMTTGNKRRVTEGANPTFVFDGTSIVFERWLDRWSDSARSELLFLGLDRERDPERIFIDASEPSGW